MKPVVSRFQVPAYLPAEARSQVPWAERYVLRLARRNPTVSLEELWDETIAALLRAAVYFRDGSGTFRAYAQTAVQRGLWRYVLPDQTPGHTHHPRRAVVAVEDVPVDLLTAPSAEDEAAAREAVVQRVRDDGRTELSGRAGAARSYAT